MNKRALHAMTPVGEGTLLRWVRQIPLCAQLGQIDRSPAMHVARFRVSRSFFSEHCHGFAQRCPSRGFGTAGGAPQLLQRVLYETQTYTKRWSKAGSVSRKPLWLRRSTPAKTNTRAVHAPQIFMISQRAARLLRAG